MNELSAMLLFAALREANKNKLLGDMNVAQVSEALDVKESDISACLQYVAYTDQDVNAMVDKLRMI